MSLAYSTDSQEHQDNIKPKNGKEIDCEWWFDDPLTVQEDIEAMNDFLDSCEE